MGVRTARNALSYFFNNTEDLMFAFKACPVRRVYKVVICYKSSVASPGFAPKHWKNEGGRIFLSNSFVG